MRINGIAMARKMGPVLAVGIVLTALSARVSQGHARLGVPEDWSHHRLVFGGNLAVEHPEMISKDVRVVHAFLQRARAQRASKFVADGVRASLTDAAAVQRDWNVSLGNARIQTGMYPAKYSFDIDAPPSCPNDFVVFGLNVAGVAGGQANMVAFNNLYAGTGGLCTSGPSVMFSYNVTTSTGGRVITSPVLSGDGKKIAFVESTSGTSIFHVLKWATGAGNGASATASAVPGSGNTASMVSITYSNSTNTRSSPFIDYNNDIAYVGADNGRIYKFTGVFKGVPTLAGGVWPVLIKANRRLTSPIFDRFTNQIFVGDASGGLYQLNLTTQVLKRLDVSTPQQSNANIIDAPLVDAVNGTVFASSSNDGTSAVLVEADSTSLAELARVRIGAGSTTGPFVNLYDGAFSDAYYTSPSSGRMILCGTGAADITPRLYTLSFTGRVVNTIPVSSSQIVNSTRARCFPITEFFNPNMNGGTDLFFFGVSFDCSGANTNGCVIARTGTGATTIVSEPGGTSGIVIDNASTAGQASSIYFTTQRNPFAAVKLTQNGLQ